MMYMNDYDIHRARRVAERNEWHNRAYLVEIVDNLREWTDSNSDGWAYWTPPRKAALKAMREIHGDGTNAADDRPDTTDAALKAALTPIKSFLTRHGVAHSEVIPS